MNSFIVEFRSSRTSVHTIVFREWKNMLLRSQSFGGEPVNKKPSPAVIVASSPLPPPPQETTKYPVLSHILVNWRLATVGCQVISHSLERKLLWPSRLALFLCHRRCLQCVCKIVSGNFSIFSPKLSVDNFHAGKMSDSESRQDSLTSAIKFRTLQPVS